jgi:uncharacterized damage-inducible protein DinB
MNISDIKFLFDYNYWANHLMIEQAAKLSAEQLKQPTGHSWGSLHGTLLHLMDSEYMWRNLCQHHNLIALRLEHPAAFPTLESIVTYWKNEEKEMRGYLDSLHDPDLEKILRYEIPEGTRERVLWHCLVHVVNHGTQHRSECGVMLTNFGHSPGNIDITRFLNQRAGIE